MTTDAPLVVIGDSLLDVDVDGRSHRSCPDVAAPVIDLDGSRLRPGGAALAALIAARSGIPVVLISAIGNDEAGQTLRRLLTDELDVLAQPLHGQTVVKTRIGTDDALIARVDTGDGRAAGSLTPAAVGGIRRAGALLISDYGRGLTGEESLRNLIAIAAQDIPLVWDPHPRGSAPVAGASLISPNEAEADLFATVIAVDAAGRGAELLDRWDATAVAVTTGSHGAVLTHGRPPSTEWLAVPDCAQPQTSASDTCGAGDSFAVAATAALQQGATTREAVVDAVAEAARYVWSGGPRSYSTWTEPHPIVPVAGQSENLTGLLERTRQAGGQIVATGGCFDLLHRGHVDLLRRARDLGDLLVVCLNSDDSIRRVKGPDRPLVGQADRARVLQALAAVDAVAIFDDDTPVNILEQIRPHVWVKGRDYAAATLPEADVVHRHGGRIVLLPTVAGYSTTRLVDAARTGVAS